MSPRPAGSHRRTRTTTTAAAAIGQLRQTRAQLADVLDELATVTAKCDQLQALVVELAGGSDHAWCAAERARVAESAEARGMERGRMIEARERDQLWHEAADPIARSGPSHADLEERRWGPGGREHFADPRPGDYTGEAMRWPAPVPWLQPWANHAAGRGPVEVEAATA